MRGEKTRYSNMSTGKRKRPTAKTIAQVAVHFGVGERWAANWFARGCPGKPGRYDLDAIERWRQRNLAVTPGNGESAHARWMEARAERETLKVLQMRGELVPLEPIRRLFVRHVNEAKALMDQIPDRVLAVLPREPGARAPAT